MRIVELHAASRGGMPLAASDLAMEQWVVLGELRMRDEMTIQALTRMMR